jgi:uncharacterized membrane protein
MSYNTYKVWRSVLVMIIAAAAAVSVVLGIVYILLAAVIIGMIVLAAIRRRVTVVVSDERTYAIAYKAARLTLAVIGVGMAVVGAVLLALSHQDFSATSAQVGFGLEYATCGLLVTNYIAYYYYNRKLGGKE